MYHGLLEMSRLIECVTAFGPDGALQVLSWSARNVQIDRVCHCLLSRWSITGMYHGLLEMSRLIECVTAFGPDGALQVCIMVC